MTTEAVVTVKWKSAGNNGGELAFDGSGVKPTKTLDTSEAMASLSKLDLGETIYCVQMDNLLDLKKSFLNNLVAGGYDVPMNSLSMYEQQLAFPMQHAYLQGCKVVELHHGGKNTDGPSSSMLFGGDLQVHYGGSVYRLIVGKTKLLPKHTKEQGKLLSLEAADPKFLATLFKTWQPIHKTYMAMRERVQEES